MIVVLEQSARYRTVVFQFELRIVRFTRYIICYVGDISIPQTWRTIESHNDRFYTNFETEYINGSGISCNWVPYVSFLPEGNYTGSNLVTAIQGLLNGLHGNFTFEVICNPARGTANIEEQSEGIHSNNKFLLVPSDFGTTNWLSNTDSDYPWRNIDGTIETVDIHSAQFINGVLRNAGIINGVLSDYYKSYQSGFIDLLNVHNIYLHCPNVGHFDSIGVRGESTMIKQICF